MNLLHESQIKELDEQIENIKGLYKKNYWALRAYTDLLAAKTSLQKIGLILESQYV